MYIFVFCNKILGLVINLWVIWKIILRRIQKVFGRCRDRSARSYDRRSRDRQKVAWTLAYKLHGQKRRAERSGRITFRKGRIAQWGKCPFKGSMLTKQRDLQRHSQDIQTRLRLGARYCLRIEGHGKGPSWSTKATFWLGHGRHGRYYRKIWDHTKKY